jgi:two-component system, sensor histidine kinase and response regulator
MTGKEKPYRILIIDDEESIRDGCRQALSKCGYEVFIAKDGDEGIKLARQWQPQISFVDLKMPGMYGLEVMDIIGRDIPDIIMVVITGYASIVSAVEAMKKGAYDYLPKPFIPDQLRAVAQRGLEHRALKIEARKLREEKELYEKGFITFVSHEMRSPLVTVLQYVETIKMLCEGSLNPEVLKIIDRCSIRLKNLEDLISHWLDISRVENGNFSKNIVAIELHAIITSAIEDLMPLCDKRGLSVETLMPQILPTIMGDEDSLLRVFTNVIGNAVKYTPTGGKIAIKAFADEYYVHVSIADTGIGIPPDKLPFIFEPFFRVKGKEERYRGSGLGLTFCKKIMDAHHGEIEVSSREDIGTTFVLKFPR